MTHFLVTGVSGLLGINFALQAVTLNHRVTGIANTQKLTGLPFPIQYTDLSQPGVGEHLLGKIKPDVLIHCAAMADIDSCESVPALAARLNSELPGELAAAALRSGTRMIHISTDAVFDGTISGAYVETDIPNPLSIYARTKLAGENAVSQANPGAIIARVNFYGWSIAGGRSLGEFFFNKLSASESVRGFRDVFFCTLLVNDLAEILMKMIERDLSGLYHVVSSQSLSKYEFGVMLARRFGFDESLIRPVSWTEGGLQAARSPNLRLNIGKLTHDLGFLPPNQADAMDHFYQLYKEEYPRRLKDFR